MSKVSPPVLTGVFPRKRLFRALDHMRKQPIIWVSGPAGSGKTTLVANYLDVRKIPCLWYQIDEGDADLATFFFYLGKAAKKAAPRKKKPLPLLTPEYLQGIPTFTQRFFENLYDRLKIPSTLVFDNYHEVPSDSPFHEVILNGLSRIPEGMNVFLVSRSDPPPASIRLRASNQMLVLGWDELRLTLDESGSILRLRSKRKLSKETIRHLHDTTDGWATGLILMLESVKGGTQHQATGKLTPEEIFDYFGNELFNKTDEETREFFLKTAFLPKMTVKMAEDLTKLPSTNRILATLSRNNYFTERRFDKELVYQYHPLFKDFLIFHARKTFSPKELTVLLHSAAKLLEEEGQTESAMSLLRDAGDWEGVAHLIMTLAPALVTQGRYRPMEEWLNSLPKDIIENNPWLLYWIGICRLVFNPSQSQSYFEKAYEKFRSQKEVAGIILACWGIVHSIIYGQINFSPMDRWIPVLEELGHRFKEFPSEEIELRFASSLFSALLYRQPQHSEIETWAERALSLAERSLNLNLKLQTISTVAFYRVYVGDFAKALLAINSLRKWSQSKESTPLIQIRLGAIEAAYYRYVGLHEKCLKAVSEGLELSRTTGIHMFDPILLYHGATSALGINDYPVAKRLLEQMTSSLPSYKSYDLCIYHSAKTQEALFQGDLSQALLHIEQATKLRIETGLTLITGWCQIQNAYVMHALGRHREAEDHLTQAFSFSRDIRGKNNEYAAHLAQAHFAFDQGEEQLGLISLRKAFALGKEGGYFSTWGPPRPSDTSRLCIKALDAGIEVEYVQEFIRRFRTVPDRAALHLENWPWPLKIYTLGQFRVEKDGSPIQFSRKVQQKPLSMLKALIALGGKEVQEGKIADAIWPEADGDDAHHSFITNLHRLRQLIGDDKAIRLREGKLTLEDRHCWVDVWAFEQLLKQAEDEEKKGEAARAHQFIQKGLEIYRGPFLAGEIEQPWMISLREHSRERLLRSVTWLGHYWEKTEQWEKAIECYQRSLEVDDVAEEFYQGLMNCYQYLGQKAKALSVYNRCKRILSSTLQIEPSPKTEKIYKSLLA